MNMREIKFRLWCENKKEWEKDPWVIQPCGVLTWLSNGIKAVNRKTHIIEQYTGLKDKNEKEIYEGDIVQFQDHIMTLVFKYGSFNAVLDEMMFYLDSIPDCVVIGNIHENSELLK